MNRPSACGTNHEQDEAFHLCQADTRTLMEHPGTRITVGTSWAELAPGEHVDIRIEYTHGSILQG